MAVLLLKSVLLISHRDVKTNQMFQYRETGPEYSSDLLKDNTIVEVKLYLSRCPVKGTSWHVHPLKTQIRPRGYHFFHTQPN